jgi:hypothetical protein
MTVLKSKGIRLLAALLMLAPPLATGPAFAVSVEDLSGEWTILIPNAFPGMVFSWKVAKDGTYQEDAKREMSGRRTQPTMSGKWSVEDRHLVMTQDSQGFVFEGDVSGNFYSGSLFLKGVPVSHFCAVKGTESPGSCDRQSA